METNAKDGANEPGPKKQDSQLPEDLIPEQVDAAQIESQIGRLIVAARGTMAWRISAGGVGLAMAEYLTPKQYTNTVATAIGPQSARTLRQYRAEACLYAQVIGQQRLTRHQIQANAKLLKKLEVDIVAKQLAERKIYSHADLRAAVSQIKPDPAAALHEAPLSPGAKNGRVRAMTERLLARYRELPTGNAKDKCFASLKKLLEDLCPPAAEKQPEGVQPSDSAKESEKNHQPPMEG